MVKKKTPIQESERIDAAPKEIRHTHKECAWSYGFCYRGVNGEPICCRCSKHPEFLKVCTDMACRDFEWIIDKKYPEEIPIGASENKYAHMIQEKVVPIFREGENTPWKTIPVSEIPIQGISWNGEPFSE